MSKILNIIIYNIGDVASVIGVIVSISVLLNLKNIKKKYLFKARIPDLVTKLKNNAEDISGRLKNFNEAKRDLETDLGRCIAALINLKKKVDRKTRQTINQLIKEIRRRKKPLEKEEMWQIYNDLVILIDSLDHLQKDVKWG